MAELLGTVVGVVSLGLQVSAGISTYLDGVQCRKEDIGHTTRRCKSMDALLQQIKSLEGQLSVSTGANTSAMREAMTSAEMELSNLGDFTTKICAGNTAHSPDTAIERVRDQKSKLLYPFRKDHLYRLSARLDSANAALQSALVQVQLKLSVEHGQNLQGLRTGLDSLSQGVSDMHLDMQASVQQIQSNGTALNSALTNVEKNTQDSTALLDATRQETVLVRKDLDEVKIMLTSLMSSSSDGRAVLPRLISKPAVLKDICNLAEDSEDAKFGLAAHDPDRPVSKRRSFPGFQCTCKPRQVSRRIRKQIGVAFWERESLAANVHASSCPLARVCRISNDKWSVGISTRALRGVLSAAITFSMSAAFGAGGFGLSPSFTYYPIRNKSPALKVIYLLRDAFMIEGWTNEDCSSLVGHGIETLQAIFTARTSSPLDIDESGRSLLGAMSSVASVNPWGGFRNKMFAFLVDLGVPRDRPDERGIFPYNFYVIRMEASALMMTVGALEVLWPDDVTSPPTPRGENEPRFERFVDVERMKLFKTVAAASSKMKTAYEGHVMGAIAQQSKDMLIKAMEKASFVPELSAKDPFGCSMLHYLMGWPEGLQTMIERYGYSTLLQLSHQSRFILLECALIWSGEICMGYDLRSCPNDCPCAQAVNLLLEAQREYPLQLNLHGHWPDAMLRASVKARDLTIYELKSRRQGLKQLALLHLNSQQIDRMDLRKDSVLDCYTKNVLETLEDMGVDIPRRFRTELHVGDWHRRTIRTRLGQDVSSMMSHKAASVYHVLGYSQACGVSLWTHELADSFYSKGFHDVDTLDSSGLSPLAEKYDQPNLGYDGWTWEASIESWFTRRGAKFGRQIPPCVTGYTVTHHVFGLVGSCETFAKGKRLVHMLHGLLKFSGTFESQKQDACKCACSINGCSPCNRMWKRALEIRNFCAYRRGTEHDRKRTTNFIYEQTQLIEEAFNIPRHIKYAWLRACTFHMLPLRHTCCINGSQKHDHEEVFEIWQEDELELNHLELLLSEFERKMEELDCSLSEFYRLYWNDRMLEVLRKMDEQTLTSQEIEAAQRLGVNLVAQDATTKITVTEDRYCLGYWLQRMDEVLEG
ncbi:hypothetical protein GCG54_00002477 [Colletotrichum gloeosporioides]|uniref:Fungal N-terminal domain-containing protein n=1 Tax=Colletotrichum gloeosporioides TaxID=474922 RepID=A0A8H4CTT3_COLGL|nr:uncharacterized protein GCG54_00002477 [Colletotrichum gloeosporioides]KAF3810028.1 hypothetical protein GCG54_00002477 [Colletotrichum gloeosporioides]